MSEQSIIDRRECRIQHEMGSCRHFNGVQHKACRLGITYQHEHQELAMPCIPRFINGRKTWECSRFEIMSREEAEKAADEVIEHERYFFEAHKSAKQDAKQKGFGRGRGGQGHVICPKCGGILWYSVAAYNGHMHGGCETEGCISWME